MSDEMMISPLALHFLTDTAQDPFEDGVTLQEAIREIEVQLLKSMDYDVLLVLPSDCEHTVQATLVPASVRESVGDAGDLDQWLALDAELLYCLQRKAIELWPRKAAVIIDEVPFCEAGDRIKAKIGSCSSSSCGPFVTVVRKGESDEMWSWEEALVAAKGAGRIRSSFAEDRAAYQRIEVDRAKESRLARRRDASPGVLPQTRGASGPGRPVVQTGLISPLSLRFTRDLISSGFSGHGPVEDVLPHIEVRPVSCAEYDAVLSSPFPAIQVIRSGASSSAWTADEEGDGEQWFSLNNRRLYALQQKAIELWPRRVATIVEVVDADAGDEEVELASQTRGATVQIIQANGDELTWGWREELARAKGAGRVRSTFAQDRLVHRRIEMDEAKDSLASLSAALPMTGPPVLDDGDVSESSDDEVLLREPIVAASPKPMEGRDQAKGWSSIDRAERTTRSMTPSTSHSPDMTNVEGDPSAEDEVWESVQAPRGRNAKPRSRNKAAKRHVRLEADEENDVRLQQLLGGVWALDSTTRLDETYRILFDEPRYWGPTTSWSCVRDKKGYSKKFDVLYEPGFDRIWWGLRGSYFLDVFDLEKPDGAKARWYPSHDQAKRGRPSFSWIRLTDNSGSHAAAPGDASWTCTTQRGQASTKAPGRLYV